MFITVMFGADCRMLVNSWCSLVTFIVHLKQKAQVPPEVTIALLAEDGRLVRLEEGTVQAPSMACSLLQEQGTYVLVRIIRGKDGAPTHYESLLDNLDDQYPELAASVASPLPPGRQLSSEMESSRIHRVDFLERRAGSTSSEGVSGHLDICTHLPFQILQQGW
ncbi:uncharacterized protein C22orf15 homolog isoform X2 [Microtus oregoni]|uniref:uncharacterized protein C22orf15 homolog isoform X2 n=1 Tax=Microtus oregoni TaxID=111838 RepID=UPI001BB25EE7|nr:uncharacterized protein C22orf15 homolog isoform X2 [Microtus oregoni]